MKEKKSTTDKKKFMGVNVLITMISCFHAIIQAIVPLLLTSEVRKDVHIIGPIFDLLRPNVLSFLCRVQELSPSVAWMEKCMCELVLTIRLVPNRSH